uniref:Large ribosomal subunit protein uL4 n=1 Tax=Stygiella incarcerata TaxID=1712417 RepID=A0A192ZI51_9EUKA|nr:60S ribosomal protein L4-2 [Stygiella incarcerata]|eukprot:TRINITY_DN137_c0_g2_i1.p1 TRINITY_DN137_c0_g2~~TRINITY_DN137_c0_g2_i1.p1  ORF type:complete len:377 (-),score=102.18 TRINITY_DN137_c0_g2_i1:71-1201(-)
MQVQRRMVNVRTLKGEKDHTISMPPVFESQIRMDIIHFVHKNMAKNKRQAYGVFVHAGEQTSAESWGTGRAVARIPRVRGGGSHRSGEAAFGNMCRGGRMYAPTKVWRKWHRKINMKQKRQAVVSALAATAVLPLVQARGHRVDGTAEIPLVLVDEVEKVTKTRDAVEVLKDVGVYSDIERVIKSKTMRAGKGKLRGRRFVQRRGPLVIYKEDDGITRAFRNIPGIDLCCADRLNLLQLAPGGHIGRLCVWSEAAFGHMNVLYGVPGTASEVKKGFKIPRSVMTVPDLSRVINSDEVKRNIKPRALGKAQVIHKKNPLRNLGAMVRLNPFVMTQRRRAMRELERTEKRKVRLQKKRASKKAHQEQKKKVCEMMTLE